MEVERSSGPKPGRFGGRRGGFYLLLGALLTIVTGILSIVNGIEGIHSGLVLVPVLKNAYTVSVCGVILIVFGIVAVASGMHVFFREPSIVMASIGAFLGILGGGFYGFWLGIAAIFLFWLSDEDL